MNRLMNYPGQKWGIAKEIVSYFPEHIVYCDPFFGSGSILFSKPRCRMEVINDLDDDVVNLFEVIRDHPEELARLIYFTPYSRHEFENCYERGGLTNIERARRFLTGTFQSQSSSVHYRSGWKRSGIKRWNSISKDWAKVPDSILEAAERLREVEIEKKDALVLIPQYNCGECLLYLDPPYIRGTRKLWMYNHEFYKPEQHEQLLDIALQHKGSVILSGYDNELYRDILEDKAKWHKVRIKGRARNGHVTDECLWMNRQRQVSIFT